MYAEYDEHEVLDRDPIELVCLLYRKALEKLSLARTLTADDAIRERNMAIARTSEIVIELQSSLNAEKGGEISVNLERLYEYIQQLLAAGMAERSDPPLAEAVQLLETLAEGWQDAGATLRRQARATTEAEPETAAAGRTWTV